MIRILYLNLFLLLFFGPAITTAGAAPATARVYAPDNGRIAHCAIPDLYPWADEKELDQRLRRYRRAPQVVVINNDWRSSMEFPLGLSYQLADRDMIPLVRIFPNAKGSDGGIIDETLSGVHDEAILAWFRKAASLKDTRASRALPVMVSLAPWPNRPGLSWSGQNNGGSRRNYGDPDLADGPERYQDFYRYVFALADRAGARNITRVFEVDTPEDPIGWNSIAAYYPGDDAVDWMGLRARGPESADDWRYAMSLEDMINLPYNVLDSALAQIREVAPDKPLALLGFGAIENPADPEAKADWIRGAFAFINENPDPLRMACYQNEDPWTEEPGNNLWFDSSPSSTEAFHTGSSPLRSSALRLEQTRGDLFWITEGILSAKLPGTQTLKADPLPTGMNFYGNTFDTRRGEFIVRKYKDYRYSGAEEDRIFASFSVLPGIRMNRGRLSLRYRASLPRGSEARLEVVDDGGRRVINRRLAGGGTINVNLTGKDGQDFAISYFMLEITTPPGKEGQVILSDIFVQY